MTNQTKAPSLNAAQDPYFLWAQATDFRDYGGLSNTKFVSVIFEWATPKSSIDLPDGTTIAIGRVYQDYLPDGSQCKYFTAQVPLPHIGEFAKCVDRFELGLAVVPVDDKLNDSGVSPLGGRQKRLIIGVIDDFVGFGHPRFQQRMTRVWSQDDKNPSIGTQSTVWRPSKLMGYGFQAVRPTNKALTVDDYPAHQKAYTHGSHVSGLILGDSDFQSEPLYMQAASIIAVHMPRRVLRDTSGGAMAVQILDGIRYILAHAKIDDQIVINISYGTYAGPHDGTSLLEMAMDQLIYAYGGRLQIVLPSGNQYESRAHANVTLDGMGAKRESLKWKIQPDDRTASFLELWMKPDDAKYISVMLKSPSGKISSLPVKFGGSWQSSCVGAKCSAAIFFPKNNAMSSASAGALIALAATASTDGGAVFAKHGVWEVWLSTVPKYSGPSISIEAYIERDDTFTKPVRGRQSYFVDYFYERTGQRPGQPGDGAMARVKRDGSMNTVITGDLTIAVGAYINKESVPSYYSGSGEVRTTGTYKPRISAVGDDSIAMPGVRSIGAFGGAVFRISGTSVAAPQVTRQIALTMASALSSAKVATGLKSGIRQAKAISAGGNALVDRRQNIDRLLIPQ
jgi:Subtilase family